MGIIICDEFTTFDIISNGMIFTEHEVIKYDPTGVESLLLIDKEKEKLSKELYALPLNFYKNSKDIIFAHSMINYFDYKALMFRKKEINTKEIIFKIIKILEELKNIEIIYWDVHSLNFLVKENEIKAIDLDESMISSEDKYLLRQKYNLTNLIIELYLFTNDIAAVDCYATLLKKVDITDYFSQDSIEFLKGIYSKDKEILDADITPIITDFEDQERRKKILGKIRSF